MCLYVFIACSLLCRLLFFLLFPVLAASASSRLLTLDFQNTNLPDAIRILAKHIHCNVVLSPAVNGMVSLHLQEVDPEQALDLLLVSQGLAKYASGNVWIVAPHAELMRRAEEQLKLQEATRAGSAFANARLANPLCESRRCGASAARWHAFALIKTRAGARGFPDQYCLCAGCSNLFC